MTEMVWSKDGQGEFDFDYLLNITNRHFVNLIANSINGDYFKSIKILKDSSSVQVIIANRWGVKIYYFDTKSKSYQASIIDADNLVWALKVILTES
ncbi:hypothetical protein MKX73_19280 [Solibacillus sp. FSL W7-1436]|uniref:hypothetical protein n=1 Tax=Solibacillus sp. FSL W7-1436 TaxID=2921705 RepID=UPI0030F50044